MSDSRRVGVEIVSTFVGASELRASPGILRLLRARSIRTPRPRVAGSLVADIGRLLEANHMHLGVVLLGERQRQRSERRAGF